MPTPTSMSVRDEVAALKRERIVKAAVELFYERGFEKTTLDAVAEQIGVTKPFIYSFFRSKAELLGEICARGGGASLSAIGAALASDRAPVAKLHRLARDFAEAVLSNQHYIAVLAREEKHLAPEDLRRLGEMRHEFNHKLVGLLDAGVAEGVFNLPDTAVAALAIGGLVSWSYVWYRPDGRLPREALVEELAALVLATAGVERGQRAAR